MPEGHTIHRYAQDHHRWLAGQHLSLSSPQGRFEAGARAIDGRRLDRVEATGKHLLYVFDGEAAEARVVHVHLGLTGRFWRHAQPPPPPRSSARLRLSGETVALDLVGPSRCDAIPWDVARRRMARLGPDPLRDDADPAAFVARLARTRRPIGAALMDQGVIAGVGNIYRAELLFAHRLDPERPAATLSADEAMALWHTTVRWLRLGVRSGRIITTLPVGGEKRWRALPDRESVALYRKPVCPECSGRVASAQRGGRVLYWCPACQTG